jgi:hypothetical protein
MNDALTSKIEAGETLTDAELAELTPEQLARYQESEQAEAEFQEFMAGDEIDFDALAAELGLAA